MSQAPRESGSSAAGTAEAAPEARESVVCPECGTQGSVALNRRDAADFCAACDFPLFWTPSVVVRDQGIGTGDNLRRLPGTGGRQTVAATPCPTCAEANPISAEHCLRCGGPMVLPFVATPEPIKVVAPVPVVEPALEPARKPYPWWWIIAGTATLLALVIVLIVVLGN